MKRKIVQHGSSTLTISLPSKWVKLHNLKKGDELELIKKDDELVIKGEGKAEKHEIFIDITKLETTTLVIYTILNLFMAGYKKIRIKYKPSTRGTGAMYQKKPFETIMIIKNIQRYMIGAEITEDKNGFCVIEEITNPDPSTFKNTFRRGFLLLLENAEYIENSDPKNISEHYEFESIYFLRFYHPDKFFQYAIKLLKESNMPKLTKEKYLLLINNLKIVGHFYAIIGEMKKRKRISQESLVKVNRILRDFYEQVFDPKVEGINKLTDSINNVQFELVNQKIPDVILMVVSILKHSIPYFPLEELVSVRN